MKVLVVVDDSQEMRIIIARMLGRDGRIEVDGAATTAADAVEEARRMQPDLVILDHYIDGPMLGLDAAPLLKEAAPATKILLFSDFDLESASAAEPAVDAYLSKRYLNELLPTVRSLLGLPDA